MRTFAIVCPELPERCGRARKHLAEHCPEASLVPGIHGETFGILPSRPYRTHTLNPARGDLNPISQCGLCLSHYMVWMICQQLPDEHFMVLEDDAKFSGDWRQRVFLAMRDAKNFDLLLIGNANCSDKPKEHVVNDLWVVRYPLTTHAYILHRRALPVLLAMRDATMKIDISLGDHVYPKLKVYTVLPRIIDQFETDLFP